MTWNSPLVISQRGLYMIVWIRYWQNLKNGSKSVNDTWCSRWWQWCRPSRQRPKDRSDKDANLENLNKMHRSRKLREVQSNKFRNSKKYSNNSVSKLGSRNVVYSKCCKGQKLKGTRSQVWLVHKELCPKTMRILILARRQWWLTQIWTLTVSRKITVPPSTSITSGSCHLKPAITWWCIRVMMCNRRQARATSQPSNRTTQVSIIRHSPPC